MVKRLLVLEDGTCFEGTGFELIPIKSWRIGLKFAMTGYRVDYRPVLRGKY